MRTVTVISTMKGLLLVIPLFGLIWLTKAGILTSSTWAVLVAGSNGWYNYRHQADVCHAYHTLINKGVHPDRIIVLMYDDIANNSENKNKGEIINKPNGTNVYTGVKIDYKGDDVNVATFKHVLLGNKTALKGKGTERVLESGPNDHVFINFVDHGAAGLLAFPEDYLFANDFIKVLKQMKTEEKYGEMVLYIEACESGSMFDNLLARYDNILASTASAPDESSYGWYCDDGNCLGDLYSITWLERLDKLNFSESLFEQFDAIRTETLQKSHVNLYGDYRLGFLQFGRFNANNGLTSRIEDDYEDKHDSGVNSRDIPLHIAQKELGKAKDLKTRQEKKSNLEKILKGREHADNLVSEVLQFVVKDNFYILQDLESKRYPLNEDIFDCYKPIISSFDENCYKITKHTYFMKHLYKFVNVCARGYEINDVVGAIEKICNKQNDLFELIV